MGDVSVVIPWRGGCEHRSAALEWVAGRYRRFHDVNLRVSQPPAGPWCKGAAIRAALPECREIVVVADADCWCEAIPAAVKAVREGAPWAMPHRKVHRLTPAATEAVLGGQPVDPAKLPTLQRPYRGTGAGGILVAPRETLEKIPPDRRFTGWGGEDGAWRDALRTLAGMEWREDRAPLIHLWHPPQERKGRHIASDGNADLARLYVNCRDDEELMRELVAGG